MIKTCYKKTICQRVHSISLAILQTPYPQRQAVKAMTSDPSRSQQDRGQSNLGGIIFQRAGAAPQGPVRGHSFMDGTYNVAFLPHGMGKCD